MPLHAWLAEYCTNEDAELLSLAIFTPAEDPLSYELAAKQEVWRKTILAKIMAIERNGTWELTTLPSWTKKIGMKIYVVGFYSWF